MKRAGTLVLVFIVVGLSAGCFGGGGASLEAQVNTVIDKYIQGVLTQNPTLLKEALASQVTLSLTGGPAGPLSMTVDTDTFIDQFTGSAVSDTADYDYTFTQLKFQISGRQVTVNGSQATVTGYYLSEYRSEYDYHDNTFFEDSTFTNRDTANVELTLAKSGGSWELTKFSYSNYSTVEI